MKVFNHITISLALFGIVGSTFPNIAVAASNQRACSNAVSRQLKKADFGSKAANAVRPMITSVATPEIMNVIKLSNRGKLTSSRKRYSYIYNKVSAKEYSWIIKNPSKVSSVANRTIENVLRRECRGVR